MGNLRWGMIGAGRIAVGALAPAIAKSGRGKLEAVASRQEATASRLARELGAPRAHGSYQALVDDPDVDAVYIGLPNGLHEPWAIACARAGKHVLCEKALAMSGASAARMAEAARASGTVLMEAFMYRHHPQWREALAILRSGEIGAPVAIQATFVAKLSDATDHRWTPALGGGVLFDITCYGINVSRYLAGEEPSAVQAVADWKEPGVDRTTAVTMHFPSGLVASALGSFASYFAQGVTVHGTEGRLEVEKPFIPGFDPTRLRVTTAAGERTVEVPGADHFAEQVIHFTNCALSGRGLEPPAEDGFANTLACEAAARSALVAQTAQVRG